MNNQYKCVVVGNGNTGKTNYVMKLLSDSIKGHTFPSCDYGEEYVATLGVEVHPVEHKDYVINFWDCAGQERYGGLRDGYYIMGDMAIVMFCDADSFASVAKWRQDLHRACLEVPIAFIWGKYQSGDDQLENSVSEFKNSLPENMRVFKMNTKKNLGVHEPIDFLLNCVLGVQSDI